MTFSIKLPHYGPHVSLIKVPKQHYLYWPHSLHILVSTYQLNPATCTSIRRHFINHCVKSVQIRNNFWSVFSRIRAEYVEIRSISPYSVRMWENTDQKLLRIWTLFTKWTCSIWIATLVFSVSFFFSFFFRFQGLEIIKKLTKPIFGTNFRCLI